MTASLECARIENLCKGRFCRVNDGPQPSLRPKGAYCFPDSIDRESAIAEARRVVPTEATLNKLRAIRRPVAAGLAPGRLLRAQESPLGGFYIWLTEATLDKLRALRGPGEG
jgi:hypothetical protein